MSKTISALVGACALSAVAQAALADTARPTWDKTHAGAKLNLASYTLVFDDEFDTMKITTAGGAGPWYSPVHANFGIGAFQGPPSPVYSIKSGVLHMQTLGSGSSWRTGNIQTLSSTGQGFTMQNGYFEVRAKMPATYGCWASIWLLSSARDTTLPHAEIDMVEYYGQDDLNDIHSSSHVWAAPNPQAGQTTTNWYVSSYNRKAGVATGFHTYGALLDPTTITLYFDGVEYERIPRQPEQQYPMYVVMTSSMFQPATELDPADMQVDYVRAYAPRSAVKPAADAMRAAEAATQVTAAAPQVAQAARAAPSAGRASASALMSAIAGLQALQSAQR